MNKKSFTKLSTEILNFGCCTAEVRSRKDFWLAFFFGIAPDLFSFGIFFVHRILSSLGIVSDHFGNSFNPEMPVPAYVYALYNFTHSLIVFSAVFLLVWLARKKPLWAMCAWGIHIVVDIPSHSNMFFPTPFLWPVSTFHIDGIGWVNPVIYIPNLIFLAFLYISFFIMDRRKKLKIQNKI